MTRSATPPRTPPHTPPLPAVDGAGAVGAGTGAGAGAGAVTTHPHYTPTPDAPLAHRLGQPNAHTFEAFCRRVESGDTVKAALRHPTVTTARDGAPFPWSTLSAWLSHHPDVTARYAAARSLSADAFADEATTTARGAFRLHGKDDKLGVQAARLRFDAARWRASVANPKRYGDRVDVTSDGEKLAGVVALPPERAPIDVVDLEEGDGYSVEP